MGRNNNRAFVTKGKIAETRLLLNEDDIRFFNSLQKSGRWEDESHLLQFDDKGNFFYFLRKLSDQECLDKGVDCDERGYTVSVKNEFVDDKTIVNVFAIEHDPNHEKRSTKLFSMRSHFDNHIKSKSVKKFTNALVHIAKERIAKYIRSEYRLDISYDYGFEE